MHIPSTFAPIGQPPHYSLANSVQDAPRQGNRSIVLQEECSSLATLIFDQRMQEIMKRMLREMHTGNVEGTQATRASLINSMLANIA